ncbi:bifunctional 4-hydroxy-2-oxoglutarate aldolase/2-dehydro-3-deoxy-phosphogluconate aldolase [Clostridium sp. AN503]|uniref:bifunctional 4-hydroxy-2-oxoglutarate aldolase/2-dehydro-3-deoxy-phosphogluconate aldolase n=1 Tax=Clostridium sp. AN503 TaxID=3160598 RepID=UPI00345AD208
MEQLFKKHKICAILRGLPDEVCLPYAQAAYNGGVRIFEVAMNSDHPARQIEILKTHLGNDASVGAGTVTTQERCREAESAGASFFLTPSVSVPVLEYCRERHIPLLPGVMTPSDVSFCLEYGYRVMKLFPAGDLPLSYIKSLKGPFDETEYVAVGGVGKENVQEFLKNGFIGAGIGKALIPKVYRENGMWQEASLYIKEMLSVL